MKIKTRIDGNRFRCYSIQDVIAIFNAAGAHAGINVAIVSERLLRRMRRNVISFYRDHEGGREEAWLYNFRLLDQIPVKIELTRMEMTIVFKCKNRIDQSIASLICSEFSRF